MRGSRRKRRKMERCSRRVYHSRCPLRHHSLVHSEYPQRSQEPGYIVSFLYNVFILASLVAVVYLMLEYHCHTCRARSNLRALTKNIDHITQNLMIMKSNYRELESKITKVTEELPKIQGQIEILDSLSDIIEQNQCHMYPNSRMYPHVLNLKYIEATPAERRRPDNQLHCLKNSKINTTVSSPMPASQLKF